jgi:hypothetical protein
MDKKIKEWIDSASYEELLRKWRFALAGDKYFFGEAIVYYQQAMRQRKVEVGEAEHGRISKKLGWR